MLRTAATMSAAAARASAAAANCWRHVSSAASKKQPDFSPKRILVTGCLGQIGSELVPLLRQKHGADNVIASDVRKAPAAMFEAGPWEYCDVADQAALMRLAVHYNVDWIVHLAGILSAAGERDPLLALRVNAVGAHAVLEVARQQRLMVFAPSSIAAFGPSTPRDSTPNMPVMDPGTMYGLTKLHLEHLGRYYRAKHAVDFRSVRYPGIISAETPPGGGTTDYAVDVFYKALESNKYECFLKPDSTLPMMMMDDCLAGTMQYLHAPRESLNHAVYNMGAISFSPSELFAAMNKFRPGLAISYKPDFRQAIADSWPRSLDDSAARQDWGWKPRFTLEPMVEAMYKRLSKRLALPL